MVFRLGGIDKPVTPIELRVGLAALAFLKGRPGEWWPEHFIFPDRKGWSQRRNRLSCLCRLHLQRLRLRGLLPALGIDAEATMGCYRLRYPRKVQGGEPCALDLLLGEQAARRGGRR